MIVSVVGFPSWVTHYVKKGVGVGFVISLTLTIVQLALLLSPTMRRYVGVGRRRSRQPVGVGGT
jgi:hypothetical protein